MKVSDFVNDLLVIEVTILIYYPDSVLCCFDFIALLAQPSNSHKIYAFIPETFFPICK